jgi:hypothetical protein
MTEKQLHRLINPIGMTTQYEVEFHDRPAVIVRAWNFSVAEIIGKAYAIHKYKTGWGVRKITSLETGLSVPEEHGKENEDETSDDYDPDKRDVY